MKLTYIPVTISDDEIVQRKLEGRCVDCGDMLPWHTIHCPLNPSVQISKSLKIIEEEIEKANNTRFENIQLKAVTITELMDRYYKEIKKRDV